MQNKKTVILIVLIVLLLSGVGVFGYLIYAEKNKQAKEIQGEVSKQKNLQDNQNQSKVKELKSFEGMVKAREENFLRVEFSYEGKTWQSKVDKNEETFIGKASRDENSFPQELAMEEIKEGDLVIVSSQENILAKESFPASMIMVAEKK
ncbi:MAG: hypothetical protein U5L10_01905 [Candidatus Moranbacteria bacterium]|nr:hypothetical protein [Candidatus Moranbacteria bacterium]